MKWLGAANSPAESGVRLHDRVRTALEQGFKGALPDYSLGPSEADLLIHQGSRVAVIEVKTGNPDLPLPSSTSAQMLLLKQRVREKFPEPDVEEVLPVLVTNYKVSLIDQKELEEQGIAVVRIDPKSSSGSDSRNFSLRVASLTGLKADPELV
ncbi:MAG: hypothetical protein ABSA78_22080 [Candidatus Sulfotelmatobacter sp.]|jgi:hypothetical protein